MVHSPQSMFYTGHLNLYCFCSNISIPISTVSLTTLVLPSLLIGSALTPTPPFLVFLFQHLQFHCNCFRLHPHLHFHLYCVSSYTCTSSFLLFLLLKLHFLLLCFCSYSFTSIFPVSATTSGRTSMLFLLPGLHLHLYDFSFFNWILVYVPLLRTCTYTFIFTSSASITELLWLVILLLSQHLYVFSSAFASTPTLHLLPLCPQPQRACTFIFTTLL